VEEILGSLVSIEPASKARQRTNPILFVHGWWGGGWIWADRFMPFFTDRGYWCHALNLPGSQESSAVSAPGKISFRDHLSALGLAVEHLGEPIIIAHSVGALLAQKLVESIDLPAVVLIAPAAPRGIFALASWNLVRVALRHGASMILHRPFLPDKKEMNQLNLNRLPHAEQEEVYRRMIPAPGRQGLEVALMGIPVNADRVRSPMLVIAGSDDKLTPPYVTQAIALKYAAEYREYPEHAHYIIREPKWEQVASYIFEWLEKITP
jgi:pimeloyl-ACP methyl ester carboxylesterase